jgi:hypothetical protein
MSLSLRAGLAEIGVHGPTSPPMPSGFASFPNSLATAIRAMQAHPDPKSWSRGPEAFADEDWSEECQGITYDGRRFITSSNGTWVHPKQSGLWSNVPNPGWTLDRSPKALYFFKPGSYRFRDDDIESTFHLGGDPDDHLGDIDFFGGSIFCAVERVGGRRECLVVTPIPDGAGWFSSSVTVATGDSGQEDSFPWCAVNPWNGLLYSSKFDEKPHGVSDVVAYDRGTGAWAGPDRTIHLSRPASGVQGACFSPIGHLYLACHDVHYRASGTTATYRGSDLALHGVSGDGVDTHVGTLGVTRSTLIQCYSAFNGRFLGDVPVTTKESNQELEGICFGSVKINGHEARIHVALLENHTLAKDNVFIKPYSSPHPDTI